MELECSNGERRFQLDVRRIFEEEYPKGILGKMRNGVLLSS